MPALAVSNIALSAYEHDAELTCLAPLGISGLEVAPSRVWRDTWRGLTPAHVSGYRRKVEAAGLQIIGLHSLFFDHPELGICKGPDIEPQTADFLKHLSALCRDLGGKTLIWGGGRKRGDVSYAAAMTETERLLEAVLPTFEAHGTCLCFEPLGPKDTDFLNSVLEIVPLVEKYASPGLRTQLDAKALVENDEVSIDIFKTAADTLAHFHANEPGLVCVGSSGTIPHADIAGLLNAIRYEGYVSIEQRMMSAEDPLAGVRESVAAMQAAYGELL